MISDQCDVCRQQPGGCPTHNGGRSDVVGGGQIGGLNTEHWTVSRDRALMAASEGSAEAPQLATGEE